MEKYVNYLIEQKTTSGICIFAIMIIVRQQVIQIVVVEMVGIESSILFYVQLILIGKFGTEQLFDTDIRSYELSTPTGGINGTDQQCLIYYYYMSIVGEKNITILKAERGSQEEMIDSVSDSPFNGWIRRNVSFTARTPNYKV